ncbi:MAG: hypothetical protein ACOX4I_02305 [Anaerovoracaceae bacterium]|jgi:hypothetical protein
MVRKIYYPIAIILVIAGLLVLCSCGLSKNEVNEAIENRNVSSLASMVDECSNDKSEEILKNAFDSLSDSEDYEDFVYMDKVLNKAKNSETKEMLHALLEKKYKNRVKAFTSGEWVRRDLTELDGGIIDIKWSGDTGVATLESVSNMLDNEFGFKKNDIKWNDMKILDKSSFKYEDLTKDGETGSYVLALAKIDYNENVIKISVSEPSRGYEKGDEQRWVRKSYIDKCNKDIPATTRKDFNAIIEGKKVDMLKKIKEEDTVEVFYWYDKRFDKSKKGAITTNRGIHVGSTKEDVIKKYGIGSTVLFSPKNDKSYKGMAAYPSAKKQLRNCKEIIAYRSRDKSNTCIRFYIDKNNEVMLVDYQIRFNHYYDE